MTTSERHPEESCRASRLATKSRLPSCLTQRAAAKQQFRREKRDVHGWVVLDKPVGMTSTQAVGIVKRLFKAKRAGHAGTLDPLASGCLPVALGEATKTVPFVMDGEKQYRFTVKWGEERATDDSEGQVTATSGITARRRRDPGRCCPPSSAPSCKCRRASRRSRSRASAPMTSRAKEKLSSSRRARSTSKVWNSSAPSRTPRNSPPTCGKGTYVRAIARDLGRKLGCFGHVCALRREAVGSLRPGNHDFSGTSGSDVPESRGRRD